MTRAEVYKLIDAERAYQGKWAASFDDKNTPNDWIAHTTKYLGQAVTSPWSHETFRKHVVKVAALAVAILEREKYAPRHYDKGK